MSPVSYTIEEFGGDRVPATMAKDIAELHSELLGHSPLVLMGPRFMQDFYYSALPRGGFISGAIAYVDNAPAGFIVATADPARFMSQALKANWWTAGWAIVSSILLSPGRLFAMKEAYDVQSNVQDEEYGPEMGELLSFGVRPEFRSRKFIKEHSVYIGTDLAERAVRQLVERGKSQVRAIIDKDNLEAQLFYRALGWRVGLADVKGWRVPSIEFVKDLA